MKAATSEQLGDHHRNPTPELIRLYGRWAEGGAALLVTGNVMVDRTALGEPRNVVLDEASDLARFRAWAGAGNAGGAQIWMQLNHPGRQSPRYLSREPVAPSAVPMKGAASRAFNAPRALKAEEIHAIIARFARSAELAKVAGFAGVQIHGAHGYLVNQFLSPLVNQRTDEWGGTLENRMRFLRSIVRSVRTAVGASFPLSVKLNSADFQRGGFEESDAAVVARMLDREGVDLLEISGGTYERTAMLHGDDATQRASTRDREAYFLTFADSVKETVRMPLAVTGGFRSAVAMRDAVQSKAIDMVGIARSAILDPDFPQKVRENPSHAVRISEPSTGIGPLDRATLIQFQWYERQIARLADGRHPESSMSAWRTLFWALRQIPFAPSRRRRGRG